MLTKIRSLINEIRDIKEGEANILNNYTRLSKSSFDRSHTPATSDTCDLHDLHGIDSDYRTPNGPTPRSDSTYTPCDHEGHPNQTLLSLTPALPLLSHTSSPPPSETSVNSSSLAEPSSEGGTSELGEGELSSTGECNQLPLELESLPTMTEGVLESPNEIEGRRMIRETGRSTLLGMGTGSKVTGLISSLRYEAGDDGREGADDLPRMS